MASIPILQRRRLRPGEAEWPSPSPMALEGPGGHLPGSPASSAGSPRTPSLPALLFQRLVAIQQVLNAQKISFLLRGGVRVLVAMRDVDTGERPGRSSPL